MGSAKNSDRRKRKYGDGRKTATAANKTKKAPCHEKRQAYFASRTEELIGKKVKIRTKDGPEIGTVQAIIGRPEGAQRGGRYLRVHSATGSFDRARTRVKIIRPTGDK